MKIKRNIFKDIHNYGGDIIKYIHPLQQKYIINILDNIPDHVEKIYLFGSSITLFCHPNSDLDLVIIGPEDKQWETIEHIYKLTKGVPKDILYCTKEEYDNSKQEFGSIYEECDNSGLLIYRRGD